MEPSPRDLVIGLLGSTYGEIKKLDDMITAPSSTLGRRSGDVKKELENVIKGLPPPPDVPILQRIEHPPQIIPAAVPEMVIVPSQPVLHEAPALPKDDSQLEFDFNRQAKYNDIVDELQKIHSVLSSINSKLDWIAKNTPERKKKVPGIVDS